MALMYGLARIVRWVAGAVALVVVVAITLRLVGANESNSVVKDIHDAGRTLVGPFTNVFSIRDVKADLAANWGLAAVVYLIAGGLLAGLIARSAPRAAPRHCERGAALRATAPARSSS
jgi:hypothetical protein